MNFKNQLKIFTGTALSAMAFTGLARQSLAGETHYRQLSNLPFVQNRPTAQTAQTLTDELFFQRATQVYLWALPLVNTLGMQVGSEKAFGSGYNILPIWKDRLNAKTLVTTPNSDVIYAMNYVDLGKDGPLVVEAPPNMQGILLDYWQRPIPVDGGKFAGDVGFAGPDGGKGGKFLLLPPSYKGKVPQGYYVYRSGTNSVFIFLRGFYNDPANLKPAVALLEQTKIYPLNGQAKPMQFPNASNIPVNMLPINNGSAFDQLKRLVDREDNHLADPDWLGMLALIGIIKGQPFNPDAHTREILDSAAKTGYKMSRVIGFQDVLKDNSLKIYADRHWINPLDNITPPGAGKTLNLSWTNVAGGYRDLDARIWFFTNYYAVSPGMISKVPGKGAAYMISFTDSQGKPLVGANSYILHLPSNIPAANFWSVTLYEGANASGLENGQSFPSLGSRNKPKQNPDGSTDIYFGTNAPKGKQSNWMATPKDKGYFAILRLYGPTQNYLDKSWKPDDIKQVK